MLWIIVISDRGRANRLATERLRVVNLPLKRYATERLGIYLEPTRSARLALAFGKRFELNGFP